MKLSVALCGVLVLLVALWCFYALSHTDFSVLDVSRDATALGLCLRAAGAMLWCTTLYCSYSDPKGLMIRHREHQVQVRHLGRFVTFTLWCNCLLALTLVAIVVLL